MLHVDYAFLQNLPIMFYDCMYILAATYIMTYVIVKKTSQTLLDILDRVPPFNRIKW